MPEIRKRAKVMKISGAIITTLSITGIIYFGSLVIKDEMSGNIGGIGSLPKTNFGPFSVYHMEFACLLFLIAGSDLFMWGYVNRRERKMAGD